VVIDRIIGVDSLDGDIVKEPYGDSDGCKNVDDSVEETEGDPDEEV
jgi:hypothetical protein